MDGLAGVVLCGGASRRMGEDKALLRLPDGTPLVVHVAAKLGEIAEPVFLARGSAGRLNLGYHELDDAAGARGPLAGIVSALRASPHDLVAVVAVDLPFVDPSLLRRLAATARANGADAVVPVSSRGDEPLHAVYARRAADHLAHALAQGRFAMRDALKAIDTRRVVTDAAASGYAVNLNTAEDVARVFRVSRTDAPRR